MTSGPTLEEVFTAERPRLVGLAYRMTGSRLDAEDIVQEAWLRAQRADWDAIERPEAWLTTVVSRLALDGLRAVRRRREHYVGPWLAEPVRTPHAAGGGADAGAGAGGGGGLGRGGAVRGVVRDADGEIVVDATAGAGGATTLGGGGAGIGDPAEAVELAETLTFGFLRLLDTLGPVERVVFLLADVFDTPYRDIAAVVDRSPEACRQIASRARRRVRSGRTRHDPPDDAARVAVQLLHAVAAGDVDRTLALLSEDVVLVSDGGREARAARRPVLGPDRVTRFLVNLTRRDLPELAGKAEMATINGEPALLVHRDGRALLVMCAEVAGGIVHAVHIVNSPAKLAALHVTTPMA